jgi:hypothetical protein
MLAAGIPIFYVNPETPPHHLIREFPDGKKQLIRVEGDVDIVVRELNG